MTSEKVARARDALDAAHEALDARNPVAARAALDDAQAAINEDYPVHCPVPVFLPDSRVTVVTACDPRNRLFYRFRPGGAQDKEVVLRVEPVGAGAFHAQLGDVSPGFTGVGRCERKLVCSAITAVLHALNTFKSVFISLEVQRFLEGGE